MKKYFMATVSVLALSTASHASDLPAKASPYAPVAMPAWTGLYLGILGGVARHDASFKDLDGVFANGTFDGNKTGGAFGGLLGYNWQSGNFVYGLEGDWSWTGVKTASNLGFLIFHAARSFDVDWLATVRGRAGLALDATLVYFTGGLAFGHVKNSFTTGSQFIGIDNQFTQNKTKVGWTAGVGVEHMFGPHWTARAELRYVDLGTSNIACTPGFSNNDCGTIGYRGEFSNTLVQGLVGLTYKF